MGSAKKQEVKANLPQLVCDPSTRKELPVATRFGFMAGEIEVPVDFDRMGEKQVEQNFFEVE